MCTVVLLRRSGHPWPLLLAANRDEMRDRPWLPPHRHWSDRPEVVGGLDRLSGGTWLGLNDHGLLAAVLNRRGTLGPAPGKRSRGELVLEALDHADAVDAARALADIDPAAYRGFNLAIADNRDAYWLRHVGEGAARVEVLAVPEGLSMLTAHDLNAAASPRIRRHLPRFRAAPAPAPERDDWSAWQRLLASRDADPADGLGGAMAIEMDSGFATVSSSLIALPSVDAAQGEDPPRPLWLFAPGRPDETAYRPVEL